MILKIKAFAYNGFGVGKDNSLKDNSKVVFVDYACPEDVVNVKIYNEHKNYSFGNITEIITPSVHRITPVCPHFTVCGGCNYLHIPYDYEIYWKKEIFKSEYLKTFKDLKAFKDNKQLTVNNSNDSPKIIKSDNYLNYRQKISLKVYSPAQNLIKGDLKLGLKSTANSTNNSVNNLIEGHIAQHVSLNHVPSNNHVIGFYKKISHNVVDVDYCCLANEELNGMLKDIRNFFLNGASINKNLLDKINSITLTYTGIKSAIFNLKERFSKNEILMLMSIDIDKIFIDYKGKISKLENINKSKNEDENENFYIVKNIKFAYEIPSFIQINKKQNENLINLITVYLEKKSISFRNALDLYCGYGNITFFIAPYAENITGVEANPFSVALANKNITLNLQSNQKLKNISFVNLDAAIFLKDTLKAGKSHDLIVIDPPRAGIKGLVPSVIKLNPEVVIYISCDPVTLLRDLKVFVQAGYLIENINLIDMFPRTFHTESVVFLVKERGFTPVCSI